MTRPAREGATRLSESARQVLEQRAQELARPLEEDAAAAPALELLSFTRGGSTYAVAASEAVAVVALGEPTPVPGAPAAVPGVVNHRGRILAVVDVGSLGTPGEPAGAEAATGIVVTTGTASFVLLAESVPELVSLDEGELTLIDPGDRPESVVRGVTGAMTAVLDLAALAHDPRIVVDEEVA